MGHASHRLINGLLRGSYRFILGGEHLSTA
jgi:hypothetical protein